MVKVVVRGNEELAESVVRGSTQALNLSQYDWTGELEHVKLLNLATNMVKKCTMYSGNLESGGEGVEGEADTTRRSILNLSVVTVFGHNLTYGAFKVWQNLNQGVISQWMERCWKILQLRARDQANTRSKRV